MSIVRAVCLYFAFNLIASAPPGSLERRRAVEDCCQRARVRARQSDGIVVMTNSDNGLIVAREVIQAFARVYGKTDFAPATRKAVSLPASALAKYAGVYHAEHAGDIRLTVEGDHLMVESTLRMVGALYPESPTWFFPLTPGPNGCRNPDLPGFGRGRADPAEPSEEHLPLQATSGSQPLLGDVLYLLPTQVCTTVNNFDEAWICEDEAASALQPVTA